MSASSLFHRLNVRGDLWTRLLHWAISICPRVLEPILITFYSTIFFLACVTPRRSALANIAVLRPDISAPARFVLAWRLFHNFAWTHVEGMAALYTNSPVGWEIRGIEAFDRIRQHPGGAIILIAHMGSYDVAASLFACKFQRPVNMVRSPEHFPETQEYLDTLRRRIMGESYAIHYNRPDAILAAKLSSVLTAGEIVALQADRVVDEISPILIPLQSGASWRLPRGPFTLAHICSSPAFPILVRRSGYRRYVVEISSQLSATGSHASPPEMPQQGGRAARRDAAILPLVDAWIKILYQFVRKYPSQWFVFEHAFVTSPTDSNQTTSPVPRSLLTDLPSVPGPPDCPTTSPRSRHGRILHRLFHRPFSPPEPPPPNIELVPAPHAGTGLETIVSALWIVLGLSLLASCLPIPLAWMWATIALPVFVFAWLHIVAIPLALLVGLACKLAGQSSSLSRKIVATTHHASLATATLYMATPILLPWIVLWAAIATVAFLIDLVPTKSSIG